MILINHGKLFIVTYHLIEAFLKNHTGKNLKLLVFLKILMYNIFLCLNIFIWGQFINYFFIDVRPISGNIGAEIHGVDLNNEITQNQFIEIRNAFGKYGVIFFRDQELSPESEIAFAKKWGKININRFFNNVNGYPEIAMVLKEPNQKKNI